MRIIGGEARGHRLKAPRGMGTRPTSDMVREALFNVLGNVEGARVLDLFAGTGALAFEALSRGATSAVLVERYAAASRAIAANAETLGYGERARLLRLDAARALRLLATEALRFDLVFMDPPYGAAEGDTALATIGEGVLLADDATVVVEHDVDHRPPERVGVLLLGWRRRYGRTEVSLYTGRPPAGDGPDPSPVP